MKWEDYQKKQSEMYIDYHRYEEMPVECPECGQNIYRDCAVVLTTYPPQHSYVCKNCGWHGTGR